MSRYLMTTDPKPVERAIADTRRAIAEEREPWLCLLCRGRGPDEREIAHRDDCECAPKPPRTSPCEICNVDHCARAESCAFKEHAARCAGGEHHAP